MPSDGRDLNDIIKEIEDKLADLQRQKDRDSKGGCLTDPPSNALVVVPGYSSQDPSGYGGDPRNTYREIRRYLLSKGVDTRIFSFGTIPIPLAVTESRKSLPTIAVDIGTLDNCFFFELRKVIEVGDDGERVNVMVLMVRLFFEGGQAGSNFWVQIVLNHHRDAVLELNQIYSRLIPTLNSAYWVQPTVGRECCRVTYFEKRFTDVLSFKHEYNKLHSSFRSDGLTGSYLEPHV
jgi:hypothetical protein